MSHAVRRTPLASALSPLLVFAVLASGCGGSAATPPAAPAPAAPAASAPPPSEPVDPLGRRPELAAPPPFLPPSPQVLEGPARSKLWLLERHRLPLVTIAVVVPYGSAAEPLDKAGLASAAADMLDEGAGDRDALAFSQALRDLGARLASSADRDGSIVSLEVLSSKLEQALPLLVDAITRPRHEKKEWTRVQALRLNALKNRASDPNEVARVVTTSVFYGPQHPYGHPPEGSIASAKALQLTDVARWHKSIWRPDVATFVVGGDVKPEVLRGVLDKAFVSWTAPSTPPVAAPNPEPPAPTGLRTFIVDRGDAPQIVMSFARPGPAASDPVYPRLGMLNIALGGSFTSRLNQNLREEHGFTYGARSLFNAQRGAGMFVARAAIRTDAISPAVRETKKEIVGLAQSGLPEPEVDKLRALLNGDALASYATLHGAVGSMAGNASLGLAPDQDAKDLASQRSATARDLAPLAAKYLDLSAATVVLVGPKEAAARALADNGFPAAEQLDAEGKTIAAARR